MKSKAMVVRAPGQMELQEFELPKTPRDHVLVKTTVTSVCSTDIKIFKGHTPVGRYPLVMGHEVAGKVVEMGSEAAEWYDFKAGDRITIEPYIACGRRSNSRSDHFDHYNLIKQTVLLVCGIVCSTENSKILHERETEGEVIG